MMTKYPLDFRSSFICCAAILLSMATDNGFAMDFQRYLAYRQALKSSNVIGGSIPKIYQFFTEQSLAANAPPTILKSPLYNGLREIDIYKGKGLWLKGNADGLPSSQFVTINIGIPGTVYSICGVIIGSNPTDAGSMPSGYMFQWRNLNSVGFRLLSAQDTGSLVFPSGQKSPKDFTTFIFDSVPANEFNIAIFSRANASISIRLTFIHSCYYSDTIHLKDCGESVMHNPRFMNRPFGSPISIKCPTDCIQRRPCWGFRVYTYDSPICWVATQNFGRFGDGIYTLYRIKKSPFFNDEIDPNNNNRIYCRSYMEAYPAIAFEKNIEVTVNAQYQKLYPKNAV